MDIGETSVAFLILFCCMTILPITLLGLGMFLHEYFSYDGGQGSDDPRGYNEFTQL